MNNLSSDIWTHDLMFQPVKTKEQALWHLKAMRGGISSYIGVLSQKKDMTEEEKFQLSTDKAQKEALTIAIDLIKEYLKEKKE